jgi:hypothetical protein
MILQVAGLADLIRGIAAAVSGNVDEGNKKGKFDFSCLCRKNKFLATF